MLDFFVKYWLQVIFGLIATGLGIACRYFYKLYKNSKNDEKLKEHQELVGEISQLIKDNNASILNGINQKQEALEEEDIYLEENLNNLSSELNIIKKGILSIQGRSFKTECRDLLKEEHVISLNEYELITTDHSIYNSLGGNHEGDALYDLVDIKYKQRLGN